MTTGQNAAWQHLGLTLLGVLVGCHAPAAHVATPPLPRKILLARQVLTDTAVISAQYPLRTGWDLLSHPAAYVSAAWEGVVRKRLGLAFPQTLLPISLDRPALDPDDLEEKLRAVLGTELQPAHIQISVDGVEALAVLKQLIDRATCRIDVLMYLWDSDPVGEALAQQLAAQAGPHRRVRVLVDGGGNLVHGLPKEASAAEVNRVVCWLTAQPYVEVLRTRNPCFRFDHRKLIVVDGQVAWTGGRNFTRPAFFEDHDLSFVLTGPLAGQAEERFERNWQEQGGLPAEPLPCSATPVANAQARLVFSRPGERQLAEVIYLVVAQGLHHVYLENPYFTDSRLLVQLVQARQRGADVRVVLTIQSDNGIISRANRVTANRLLRAGVRVYLYPGMTHAKSLVVDGRWAYLGTGNFDSLSLRHNRELGVAVSSGPVIAELEDRLFHSDFRPDWELVSPLSVLGSDYIAELLASRFL